MINEKIVNEEIVVKFVLEKICMKLDCNIEDIIEFTKVDEIKKKY